MTDWEDLTPEERWAYRRKQASYRIDKAMLSSGKVLIFFLLLFWVVVVILGVSVAFNPSP